MNTYIGVVNNHRSSCLPLGSIVCSTVAFTAARRHTIVTVVRVEHNRVPASGTCDQNTTMPNYGTKWPIEMYRQFIAENWLKCVR